MNLFNNYVTNNSTQNQGLFAPSQSNLNTLDTNRAVRNSLLADITNKLAANDFVGAKDEIESLITLLKDYNVSIEYEQPDPQEETSPEEHQLPSIQSSTSAYTKVLEAFMEVIDKLNEKEKEFRQKMKNDAEADAVAQRAEQLKRELSTVIEKLQFKSVENTIDEQKDFKELENFLLYIRDRYNIDIKIDIKTKVKSIRVDTLV